VKGHTVSSDVAFFLSMLDTEYYDVIQ